MSVPFNERKVARGLRRGRVQAWQQIYDDYAETLWDAVARRLGSQATDVGDVVHDTFLTAAQSARKFDPKRGTLKQWLWGIAHKQIALYFRKRARLDALAQAKKWWASLNGQARDWVLGKVDAPDLALESRELAELVRAALADLPSDYAVLLEAKYLQEQTVNEIANELGGSNEAIRSKLARARKSFRQTFLQLAGDKPIARQRGES